MNRRRFLTACIATIAAPAIVRAESLMPVRNRTITGLWGIGNIESFRYVESKHGINEQIARLARTLDDIGVPAEDRYMVVMHPDMARALMNMRPNKVWHVPGDRSTVVLNRWLPRTP